MDIYLDNAATTKPDPVVLDKVFQCMRNTYGNAGSMHAVGFEAKCILNSSRKKVESILNADDNSIVFTSGGSEANSVTILGLSDYLKRKRKNLICRSSIEHPSVIESFRKLTKIGFKEIVIPVYPTGTINMQELSSVIDKNSEKIGLVSVMAVNNELGTVQPIKSIGELCRKNDILFHTDCVQAVGTIDINVQKNNIDFATFSGHKFHAPKGVGAVYVKDKTVLSPIVCGGGQEFNIRSGTENVPGMLGFSLALEDSYKRHLLSVGNKQFFVHLLRYKLQDEHIEGFFNGDSAYNLSKIISVRLPKVDAQSLVLMLNAKGVYVSAGSACKSTSTKPSHVLKAIGLSDDEARNTIRISISSSTTRDEIRQAVGAICECAKRYLQEGI